MKYSDYKKILRKHHLRITDSRIDVLERFYNTSHALSFKDLEEELEDYDRVTLYRTLNSFIDQSVIHRIPDDTGSACYGLCYESCTPDKHFHDHVHFKCIRCGNIDCLPDIHVPIIDLPDYEIIDSNLIINGICKACRRKEV